VLRHIVAHDYCW